MKEIKKKSVIKDIKVLDKSTDMSSRMKNVYIRTKDQAEQIGHNDNSNYVDDAEKSIQESAETVVRKTGYTVGNYSKNMIGKIKKHHTLDADSPHVDTSNGEQAQQVLTSEVKEEVHRSAAINESKPATEPSTTSVKSKEVAKQSVSQPRAKQAAKCNAIQYRAKEATKRKFTITKANELTKRRYIQSRVKQWNSQTNEIRTVNHNIGQMQSQQISGRIPAQRYFFQPARKAATQTLHTSGRTRRTMKQSAGTVGKTVKEVAKGTIKKMQKSVKTAENTAKTTIKTSQAVAKTTAKTTVKTAQTTQRAAQAARYAARAAAVTAKMAAKAIAATIKAIIVAVKGLIAMIAAGGWIAVIVILVICLAGFLLGSVYGVFFSNESSGENMPVMTEVVRQLNEEFTSEIERIQDENPHDTLKLSGSSTIGNWQEILAVYVVKITADPENGMEVATIDAAKVEILRDIFWDMRRIDYWTETIEYMETVTTSDKDGNETEETITVTEIILHINVISKFHTDMIVEYGFNAQQVKMLNELMQDEYQQLFMHLIGS